jgi:hypothetical protein
MKLLIATIVLISLAVFSKPAESNPAMGTDQVRGVYTPPTDPKHQAIYRALRERQVLETLRTLLSPLRLPRKLTLEVRGCDDRVDAFYDDDTVTLCYEYVDLIQRHAPIVSTAGGTSRRDSIFSAVMDTMLHEVGHAVFDMLEIPVFGREEDAADFFSIYILTQFGPSDARRLIDGTAFVLGSEAKAALAEPLTAKKLSGEHALLAQRYYNLLCMAYGKSSDTFGDVASKGGLSKERAEGCSDEFEMLERAFSKLIMPHVDASLQRDAFNRIRFNWAPATDSASLLDAPPLGESVRPVP